MSDSSSVDRWHPSNALAQSLARIDSLWRFHKEEFEWADKDENLEVLSAAIQEIEACHKDYATLFADRGRVLAAIEKRVEGLRLVPPNVGYGDGWQDYNSAIDDALNAIKSSSSSSTEEREV